MSTTAQLLDRPSLLASARSLAGGLVALRPTAGELVAVLAGNTPDHVAARLAAAAVDSWFIPINPRLTAPEIAHALATSGARLLVVDAALGPDALARARAAAAAGSAGDEIHVMTFAELGAAGPAVDCARQPVGATILFTSGTTGRPKACLRTDAQEQARADELIATYSLAPDDVHLIACPLAHSAPGIFLRAALRAGARTALLPRFDASGFLAAVAAARATVFFLVPTQVERLLALPPDERAAADLSSVRAFIVAGAPFPVASKRRLLDWIGPDRLWEFYGSSETGTIATSPPHAQPGAPGFVGWPPPDVDVRLLDERGAPVAGGAVGEIFVRSPAVMRGYLGDAAPAGGPAAGDGFVSVGDLGTLDAGGGITLVDRKYDTIITGGVNVYPAEIEQALAEHPAVAATVACGLPDDEWGQIVAALVAVRAGVAPPGADDLRAFLRERLASFKVPRRIAFVPLDTLPVGPSGKPLRRIARDLLGGATP